MPMNSVRVNKRLARHVHALCAAEVLNGSNGEVLPTTPVQISAL